MRAGFGNPGGPEFLEDLAFSVFIRTGSMRMTAEILRRPKSTVFDYVQRARKRTRDELLGIDPADAASDALSRIRLTQKIAMEEFEKALPGSFQRNAFLRTYLLASHRETKLFQDLGIIPKTRSSENIRQTSDTKPSIMDEVEKLSPGLQERAVTCLFQLLAVFREHAAARGEASPVGGSDPS
jgi:hypothetical protein